MSQAYIGPLEDPAWARDMELSYSGEARSRRRAEELAEMFTEASVFQKILPGCKRVAREDSGYVADLLISVGPLSGEATMRWTIKRIPSGLEMSGRTEGLESSLKFSLQIHLEEAEGGSIVRWTFNGRLEGLASLLDKRIVDRVAGSYVAEMTKRVAEL